MWEYITREGENFCRTNPVVVPHMGWLTGRSACSSCAYIRIFITPEPCMMGAYMSITTINLRHGTIIDFSWPTWLKLPFTRPWYECPNPWHKSCIWHPWFVTLGTWASRVLRSGVFLKFCNGTEGTEGVVGIWGWMHYRKTQIAGQFHHK